MTDAPKLTSLQKRYVDRLTANVEARKLLEQTQRNFSEGAKDSTSLTPSGLDFDSYLRLLRQRRQNDELQVLSRHVERLSQTEAAQPRFLNDQALNSVLSNQFDPEDAKQDTETDFRKSIEDLTQKLERAVLQARYQLEHEKLYLAKIKARELGSPVYAATKPTKQLEALTMVQNELFGWIEDKLAASQDVDESDQDIQLPQDTIRAADDTESSHESSLGDQINARYEVYLKSRKRLLDAISQVLQPSKPGKQTGDHRKNIDTDELHHLKPTPMLPMVERQLLPAQRADQDAKSQLKFLSTLMKESQDQVVQKLRRLADESHLLAAYPLLSQSGKFAHITKQQDTSGEKDEIGERVAAWTFASESARAATEAYAEEQLGQANDQLDQAGDNIQQLRRLAGEEDEGQSEEVDVEEDVWAGDIKAEQKRDRQARQAGRARGQWSRLNGRIGYEERS